jgi:circadian clock protein KaiC
VTRADRLHTGVRNLDGICDGGLVRGSLIALSGPPGSGKTILAQQICFHNTAFHERVLYFGTLSEPTAKLLRNLKQFSFFQPEKLGGAIEFVDLGEVSKAGAIAEASALITSHLKRVKPTIIVIDSFKAFDDLARSRQELRSFGYEIAVTLMAWEATTFLLGEFGPSEYQTNPLFSIVDGICVMSQREVLGEHQRFFQVVKMRGTSHSRDEHPFAITHRGIDIFAARTLARRDSPRTPAQAGRCRTGIAKLDDIIGAGIPRGASLLVSGAAGTGKTVLSLEFLYRGAQAGEKGILFSFAETEAQLRAAAHSHGWQLDREIERGMVEIVFIPQPEIMVDAHLVLIRDRIAALGATRVVIDSLSVFLHRIADPQPYREKVYHLCSIIQHAQAVALFPTDVPYGTTQISRFGVEETVVDGVIVLCSIEEGLERQRYIEVYKLRDSVHLEGRHNMVIGAGGISVFPRYEIGRAHDAPGPVEVPSRLPSGVPGLDPLLGGGLLARSITLVSGSTGIGKTTIAVQFLLAGVERGELGLCVLLEDDPEPLIAAATALGLPLRAAIDRGDVHVLCMPRQTIRVGELVTVLADRLVARKAVRVVIDAVTHLTSERLGLDEPGRVLCKLAGRFKVLGVTSLFTLDAASLYSNELMIERSLSPLVDNLVMLRYREACGGMDSMLTVVKTRGSEHDRGTHRFSIGHGGVCLDRGGASG